MTLEVMLGDTGKIKILADRLSISRKVSQFDKKDEPESWTLAYTFSELEESFRKFLLEQLPKLFDEKLSDADIDMLLNEIGEEFRHILYHLKDPEYYTYLHDAKE